MTTSDRTSTENPVGGFLSSVRVLNEILSASPAACACNPFLAKMHKAMSTFGWIEAFQLSQTLDAPKFSVRWRGDAPPEIVNTVYAAAMREGYTIVC